jgi:hypothetical protein
VNAGKGEDKADESEKQTIKRPKLAQDVSTGLIEIIRGVSNETPPQSCSIDNVVAVGNQLQSESHNAGLLRRTDDSSLPFRRPDSKQDRDG